jgi:hypothetical protein
MTTIQSEEKNELDPKTKKLKTTDKTNSAQPGKKIFINLKTIWSGHPPKIQCNAI